MFIRVLAAALLILAAAIVVPVFFVEQEEAPRNLPWQVEPVDGTIRIFGITLGQTTLGEAEQQLGEPATVSLFRTPSDELDVEAYFDQVNLSGLDARLVATVTLSRPALEGMFDRGLRVSTLGSGTRKVTLAPEDLRKVKDSAVGSLTYLPKIHLTEEQVRGRFGEPDKRISDLETGAEHWLYPKLGLDVAIHPEQKEVLQYVPPERFDAITAPLLEQQS